MELHRSRPGDEDRWRVFSYSKCQSVLLGGVLSFNVIGQAYER